MLVLVTIAFILLVVIFVLAVIKEMGLSRVCVTLLIRLTELRHEIRGQRYLVRT